MMPCTISVYEKAGGRAYVAAVNVGSLGKHFGGGASKVLGGDVARDQARMIDSVREAADSRRSVGQTPTDE
jgi:hypothetical protein